VFIEKNVDVTTIQS